MSKGSRIWRSLANLAALASPLALFVSCEAPIEQPACGVSELADCEGREVPQGLACIPSGSFSRRVVELDPYRSHEVCIVISRPLLVDATEVTQGAWKALSGGTNPSCQQTSILPNCLETNDFDRGPVETVDWYSAIDFANARSAREGLERCYQLEGCDDPVDGWKDGVHSGCGGWTFRGLECLGYRLSTQAEWEYFARAGSDAATYAGDLSSTLGCGIVVSGGGGFAPNSLLTDLGWFACNSEGKTQSVGMKAPNQWGLFDLLGNVAEWNMDSSGGLVFTAAVAGKDRLSDPLELDTLFVLASGGGATDDAYWMHIPSSRVLSRIESSSGLGIRLVRSLPPLGNAR